MRKINKDYMLRIMFIAVSITLLFTGRLYSDPALKKTLRLPIGTKDDTYDRISETVEFYDRHAEEYAEIWAQDDPNMPPFYERFPNLVPKGSVVLDSGCGPGRDLLWFLDNGYSATGIDLSEATVSFCQMLWAGFLNRASFHPPFKQLSPQAFSVL